MPKNFSKYFRADGCSVHYRKRKRGKNSITYEARYRKQGYNISVSAPTLDTLKQKFIDTIKAVDEHDSVPEVPETFAAFADYYFTNFWLKKVGERTATNNLNRYNRHVLPYFKNTPLKKITPLQCQKLIESLQSKGKGKTADEVKSILNGIFNMAVKHNLIKSNPIDVIFYKKYEQKHGKALSKDEEEKLLTMSFGTPYHLMFAVALYTGLRPNEYSSAHIEGDFIIAINSKQKDGKVHYKKIPITPMLRPYLNGISELKFYGANRIAERLKSILPNHKLYDLRTTFYTRCQECGIADIAIKKFVGHSLGGLADTYTDLSDKFLLDEGAKFKY